MSFLRRRAAAELLIQAAGAASIQEQRARIVQELASRIELVAQTAAREGAWGTAFRPASVENSVAVVSRHIAEIASDHIDLSAALVRRLHRTVPGSIGAVVTRAELDAEAFERGEEVTHG